jgi:hypothetical protein
LLPWGFAFPVKDVPVEALVMTIYWFISGLRSNALPFNALLRLSRQKSRAGCYRPVLAAVLH